MIVQLQVVWGDWTRVEWQGAIREWDVSTGKLPPEARLQQMRAILDALRSSKRLIVDEAAGERVQLVLGWAPEFIVTVQNTPKKSAWLFTSHIQVAFVDPADLDEYLDTV